MNRSLLAIIAVFSTIAPSVIPAQSASASSRTREIAALFSKNKHVVKEKRGVRTEKYKNVSAEPLIAANPTILSGTYRAFDAHFLSDVGQLADGHVLQAGKVEGVVALAIGLCRGRRRRFADLVV